MCWRTASTAFPKEVRSCESRRNCWQAWDSWTGMVWMKGSTGRLLESFQWGRKKSFWHRNGWCPRGKTEISHGSCTAHRDQSVRGKSLLLLCTINQGTFAEGSYDAEWLQQIAVEMWDWWRQNNAQRGKKLKSLPFSIQERDVWIITSTSMKWLI